jgi:short-subunit dehydrogenase
VRRTHELVHAHVVRQMNVNVLGAVAVTKAFQPALEASRGVICCVNSFGGVMPLKNMTAYTASKFALAGFADALRYEMTSKGVHVAQVRKASFPPSA